MLNIGGAELLIILLVALVFLGPERLPTVARQLGQTVSSLRSLASGFQAEVEAATKAATDDKMSLDGPTDQADAIAATQDGAVAASVLAADPAGQSATPQVHEPVKSDPFAGSVKESAAPTRTDPFAIKEAARKVSHDDEGPISNGGPTDLREDEDDAVSVAEGSASDPPEDEEE